MQQYSAIHKITPLFRSVISEHKKYNQTLHQLSVFPNLNTHTKVEFSRIVLFFRFRCIKFSKKRALPFFLALELLSNHKCIASLSRRNIQAWKMRKGILVGCKVTLRRESLNDFINRLSFTFPRMEKFQPRTGYISKFYKKYTKQNRELINQNKINPGYRLTLGELVLFYPIELGLGLHPDVQRVTVNFRFESFSIEERFFTLRYAKVPVYH